jgi:hypothetical protein
MSDPYLTVDRFIDLTDLSEQSVRELADINPNYLPANIDQSLRSIEDRLRHKYAIPFPPNHATIEGWIVCIVQSRAINRIGTLPNDQTPERIFKLAEQTDADIKEASNPQSANWNLPLITATDASGIVKGAPFGYAESSPYTWTDVQYNGGTGG